MVKVYFVINDCFWHYILLITIGNYYFFSLGITPMWSIEDTFIIGFCPSVLESNMVNYWISIFNSYTSWIQIMLNILHHCVPVNTVWFLTPYGISTAWSRHSQSAFDFWARRRVPSSQLCLNRHVHHIHGHPGGTADRIYRIQVRLSPFFLVSFLFF